MAEIFGELLFSVVSVLVGLVLGSVALIVMLGLRRAVARVSRSSEVEAPNGEIWSVRVVYGIGRRLGTRFAGMSTEARRKRRAAGQSDTAVGRDEIWHPRQVLDAFDEAAGLVAPFVVAAAVMIGVIFVVEMVIALPIGVVFLVVSAIRGRWQVEIVDPNGVRSIAETGSLTEAREMASRTAERIAGGAAP